MRDILYRHPTDANSEVAELETISRTLEEAYLTKNAEFGYLTDTFANWSWQRKQNVITAAKARLKTLTESKNRGMTDYDLLYAMMLHVAHNLIGPQGTNLVRYQNYVQGWTIVLEAVYPDFLLFCNNHRNQGCIAVFRGTDIYGISDFGYNIAASLGWVNSESTYNEEALRYLKLTHNIERLVGYSRGGRLALELGELLGISTHTFNPMLNNYSLPPSSRVLKHTIVTVKGDVWFDGASRLPLLPQFTVRKIRKKDDSWHGHTLYNVNPQE